MHDPQPPTDHRRVVIKATPVWMRTPLVEVSLITGEWKYCREPQLYQGGGDK
ncbi:MAG: hypothetical protein ACK5BB_10685 [Burkholderiaceae bacterium]